MKRTLRTILPLTVLTLALTANAQRYTSEVFNDAQIVITPNIPYGTNIDFLTSDFSNPSIYGPEVVELQTDVSTQQPIPAAYFDPSDVSTALKVANLRMDVYQPHPFIDCETARPVVIFIHTGNALPPPLNGSPCGTKTDSSAVEVCRSMARRGYVAISIDYRLGWNPLGTTPEIRRGTLLNAIYRAIHDVKQCVRSLKQEAAGNNALHIDPSRIILFGEGTGGYISLAASTLDHPSELYIEKFRPDPFVLDVSYVDSTVVGNIEGFGGQLCLYRPNGFDSHTSFCVNEGGALADTSWLAPGDVPMVALHTTFDPFAPFTEGIVIVPTTGEQVVPVQGSNLFMQLVNQYGNNASFAGLPDGDPYTDRARSLYGTTQVHSGSSVTINTGVEGLFPLVTTDWPFLVPGTMEEASPWQWWDPNSAIAQTIVVAPDITANTASLASNPNSSAMKGRAYIDTAMGYVNPRIVAALNLQNCMVIAPDCQGNVGGNALPGTPCDDSNANTGNDHWTPACVCVGEVIDCLGVIGGTSLPGTACDDGSVNTFNDTYGTDCVCSGFWVGIDEAGADIGLALNPNPVHDVLHVSSDKVDMRSYTIFDATGRSVRNEGVQGRSFIVDRTGLQAGAYFITIRFNDRSITRRIALD